MLVNVAGNPTGAVAVHAEDGHGSRANIYARVTPNPVAVYGGKAWKRDGAVMVCHKVPFIVDGKA